MGWLVSLKDMHKQGQLILSQLEKIEALELEIQARILDAMENAEDSVTGLPLTADNIKNAVKILADKIVNDTTINNPILVSVMDGAMPFAGELQAELNRRGYVYQYTTMQASSYHGTSSGQLSIQAAPKIDVAARHVLVIDEVCDTGKTYDAIRAKFERQGAKSTRLVVLVDKKQTRVATAEPWLSGFIVTKEAFIIGKGLDFDGLLRNLDYIGVANLKSLPTPAEKAMLATKKSLINELKIYLSTPEQKRRIDSSYVKLASVASVVVALSLMFLLVPLSISLLMAAVTLPMIGIAIFCIPDKATHVSPKAQHASEAKAALKSGAILIPEPVKNNVTHIRSNTKESPVTDLKVGQHTSHSMFVAGKDRLVIEEQALSHSRVLSA